MTSLIPFKLGLKLMGLWFRFSKKFRREIYQPENDYKFNTRLQMTTRSGDSNIYIEFKDGKMRSGGGKIENPELVLTYRDRQKLAKSYSSSPEDTLDYLLSGDLYTIGSLARLIKFSYLTTIFPRKKNRSLSKGFPPATNIYDEQAEIKQLKNEVLDRPVDNVKYLKDPYLGRYSLADFPRLLKMKNRWFIEHPWICSERAKNITEFHKEEGFEVDKDGNPWHPGLRQGLAMRYILSKKSPNIFEDDLIPGSTTSMRLGVQIFPEFGGVGIWPELQTVDSRPLNPYRISNETRELLNNYVFPYWIDRNIRERARIKFNNPLSQRLDEFFSLYFEWKTQAISHTIPNFSKVLENGLLKLIEIIEEKIAKTKNEEKTKFLNSLKYALEGVLIYTENLRKEAINQLNKLRENHSIKDEGRIKNLEKMLNSMEQVPAKPAQTFQDAIIAVWILWHCLQNESMNAGLSLGRLDQVLYPYFENDMQATTSDEECEEKIKEIIELVGAFYFKCQDHLPLVPNVGNKLFGGSSSDQALTLGGVTSEGENAVNDLTYIFLKVTEMLSIRDPNVNARYNLEMNSIEYLRRLCEVNINTTSTPSIHNDKRMIEVLEAHGFKPEDARNWAATGCVEPTSIGKHFGHTNCMLLNLVAPLEMTINNGFHPLIHPRVGPETGVFNLETYPTFESLLEGYKTQLAFLIDNSIEYNNNLGKTHQEIHPTPLLSAIFDGPLEKGKDLVDGGAIYNSSGAALVALPDVADSLMAVKKVVYEWQKISLEEFKLAMERDFTGPNDNVLLEYIKKVPKFGANNQEVDQFAQLLVDFIYDQYYQRMNYRGGHYMPGFWSMSNHVAFGKLSGTMPSGRLRGKAFTPGITPAPGSSDQLLENIKSVASINSYKTPNNIAFNVKLVPDPNDTHEETLDQFVGYAKSYFDLGGLQMQFNVVTSAMLREAMEHPEQYRWLMVRISGYNAYFTELNRDMQIELIERMEFKAH